MAVTLVRSLETAVPSNILVQEQVKGVFAAQPGLSRLGQRLVTASFDGSGIDTRHTVIDELRLDDDSENPQFFAAADLTLLTPGTRVRNELYIQAAGELTVQAGRRALDALDDIDAADVTHVVTVSCTGFFAPGPDYLLVKELGLNPATQRYHLGFMGCYAAMPALRLAKSFCDADANAVVLVVSVELCSLHVRSSNDPDTIVASSLFADGAAAAIVTQRPGSSTRPALSLDHFETIITPVGEADMAWKIGDEGFEMVLSSYVPHIIDEHIGGALEPLLRHEPELAQIPGRSIAHWAIHPGGRSILDKVESRLELTEHQLHPSRETLRRFGNMSSATVLFVLKHILEMPTNEPERGERICAMAFGPGLTVETALMTKIPAV